MKRVMCVALFLLLFVQVPAEIWIRINKIEMNLLVFDDETLLAVYPISCGKNTGNKQVKGDMRTPEGSFTIVSIEDSHLWRHDFGDGKGPVKNAYGPWFLRLSCGNSIGIHGTHAPESMGQRASEGCVRMLNEDIEKLKPLVETGTVVEIMPDRK